MSDEKASRKGPKGRPVWMKTDYGDGRDPLAKHTTLLPSPQAAELARHGTAVALAFFLRATYPIKDADTDWLEPELAYVADEYLRRAQYAALPSAEEYRAYGNKVGSAARTLLDELKAGRDKSWGLDQGSRRDLKLRLWSRETKARDSFEELLLAFTVICDEFSTVKAPTAPRPRDDLSFMAGRLAHVWELLTKRRCPTSLVIDEIGGRKDFQAEGPRFVHAVARALDPSVTLAQVKTALRKRPSRKPRSQSSTSE